MQAIQTKFIGPSNVKGSRYKAWAEADSVTLSADHSLNADENQHRAALALCRKLKWSGRLVTGGADKGNVYVFDTNLQKTAGVLCVEDWGRRFTIDTEGKFQSEEVS